MSTKIVAELSANHQGTLDTAMKLVEAAERAGADAVKLQTWDPASMVLDPEFVLRSGPWVGKRLADLYAQAHTPMEWHWPLFERAKEVGIEMFSSVFDLTSLKLLESLDCPRYKIASFEIVDLRLIRYVAATGKPIIISTGMATFPEIEAAYGTAYQAGARDITLLKCTSDYPAEEKDANLSTMHHMKARFPTGICKVGLSDHTSGITAGVLAAYMGASMVEKHFTLSREAGGLDSEFSIEPHELATLVREANRAAQMGGTPTYGPSDREVPQLELRRSLYFARAMEAGEEVKREDIASARPRRGISPAYFEQVVGAKLLARVERGTPVKWELIERKL